MRFFFVWSPWTFRHVIFFHISVVMCCSSQIPFDDLGGLLVANLCRYCFALFGMKKKKVYCCILKRFVVVDE